jgi:hypothetical protein
METWQKHEIRPHQGAGPAPDPLPTEPLPALDNSGADSRDVEEYVLRMRRIRDREAGRVVDEPPAPVSIVGTVVTREETGKNSVLPDGPDKAKTAAGAKKK